MLYLGTLSQILSSLAGSSRSVCFISGLNENSSTKMSSINLRWVSSVDTLTWSPNLYSRLWLLLLGFYWVSYSSSSDPSLAPLQYLAMKYRQCLWTASLSCFLASSVFIVDRLLQLCKLVLNQCNCLWTFCFLFKNRWLHFALCFSRLLKSFKISRSFNDHAFGSSPF